MPQLYLSPAWTEELKSRISALPAARTGNVTASLSLRHMRAPGGGEKYLYLAFQNGALVRAESGMGAGPGAEFAISGDYAVFADVLSGKLDAGRALSGGKLRLHGNLFRAMGLTPLVEAVISAAQGIPTAF